MPNKNGLTSLPIVFNTGSSDSSFWAKANEPVYSVFTVEGVNGTSTVEIVSNNAGSADGVAELVLNDDSSNGIEYEMQSTQGSFYVSDVNNNKVVLQADKDNIVMLGASSAPVVKIGAGNGIVYDTVYNPIPASPTTALNNFYNYNDPGNQRQLTVPLPLNENVFTLTPGVYQLNAYFSNLVIPVGSNYLELYVQVTQGSTYEFSRVRLQASSTPTGAGSFVALSSSSFQVSTTGSHTFIFTTDGSTTPASPWTSDIWSLQLVKFA